MADRWSLGNLLLMDINDQPNRLLLPGVTDSNGFTQYSFFNLLANYDAKTFALYFSDEWQVTDDLRIDLGIRYDDEDVDASISDGAFGVDFDGDPATLYDNNTALVGSTRTNSNTSVTNTGYSIGFNFDLNDEHAFFGHYTDSARLPHFDDIRGGVRIKDDVSNIELGYKTSLDLAAVFITLFQTEFDNVSFNDILADGSTVVRQAGTRTRGVEIEGVWEPVDAFSLGFSITVQDPEYTSYTGASVDNTGNRIRRIPKSMIRLTPTYNFADFRGRVYLTYSHVGDRFANDVNTIVLPSYDKLDAGIIYDISEALSLQLNVDNLTDEVGLTEGNPRTDVGAGGVGTVYNARPLFGTSIKASATYRF
jgi:outer membrane receptor protein involved in Fe transport